MKLDLVDRLQVNPKTFKELSYKKLIQTRQPQLVVLRSDLRCLRLRYVSRKIKFCVTFLTPCI